MRPRLLIPALLAVVSLLATSLAWAELAQEGNVRISFDGDFSPRSLPRERLAPVTIDVKGAISTTDGTHPPAVRKVEIAINRHGKLSTEGLPACSGPLLQSTSTETALARCRSALVGRGRFGANVEFPNGEPVLATGRMLAFYGHGNGNHHAEANAIAKAHLVPKAAPNSSATPVTGDDGLVEALSSVKERGRVNPQVAVTCRSPSTRRGSHGALRSTRW